MKKSLKKFVALIAAGVMALSLSISIVPESAGAATLSKAGKKAAKADFDPDGTYHAYFGLEQTNSWIFRNPWYSEELGIEGSQLEEAGLPYEGAIYQSHEGIQTIDGVVTDAEITGNGTYSVSVSGLNGCLTEDSEALISMIFFSTDIPMTAKDNPVTITDWKLYMDGQEVELRDEPYFPLDLTDASGLMEVYPVNTYQSDKGNYADAPFIMSPSESIQIVFTISGFNSDNPDATDPEIIGGAADEGNGSSDDSASNGSGSDSSDSGSTGSGSTVAIVVVVVIVIVAIVAVVVVKKKKE